MSIFQNLQESIAPFIEKQQESGVLQTAYFKETISRTGETLTTLTTDGTSYLTDLTKSDSFSSALQTHIAFEDNLKATIIDATKANLSAATSLFEELTTLFNINREMTAPANEIA